MNPRLTTALKAHLHTDTTLGKQHQLKEDNEHDGPVAIVFHTTGSLGPSLGEDRAKRLAICWNACTGLELPDDVTPGALAEVVRAARVVLSYAYEEPGHGIGSHIDRLDTVLGALETVPRGPFECRPHADQIRGEYAASDDPDAVLRKYKLGSLDELGPVSLDETQFDNTQANAEGWNLWCLDDDVSVEIEATIHGPFTSDSEAVDFVREKSAAGSAYHTRALELAKLGPVSPTEDPDELPEYCGDRIERGGIILRGYSDRQGLGAEEDDSILGDLLADLRHFCADTGLDFEAAVSMSEYHFNEEPES